MLATSQPTISEYIKSLEQGLGCRLFDRLGRSIRATEKAEILYPQALAILENINKVKEELAAGDQGVSGDLVIGASSIPGVYKLPYLLSGFKSQYPKISFEIRIADSDEIIEAVLNHDLLIGIVGTQSTAKNLVSFPFVEDELVLAVAAERKIGRSISIKELLRLPFLIRESGSGTRKSLEIAGIRHGLDLDQLNIVGVLGSNAAIKEAIKNNLGGSILSRVSISDEL